ncbi:MAG: serine/threonine-protein kinase [Polyangia bacterium]|jgi:serine/threonine-protein kinase|nr:serine/threonine-protein kinase [Polyangia bacterium]
MTAEQRPNNHDAAQSGELPVNLPEQPNGEPAATELADKPLADASTVDKRAATLPADAPMGKEPDAAPSPAVPWLAEASKGKGVPTVEFSKDKGSDRQRQAGSGSGEQEVVPFDPSSVPPEQMGPLTGKLLEQRYLIKEKLGEGGMGVVYRAEHTLMRKEMAVKVLLPQFGSYEGITKRFHREAQSASRLDHPGIIHINDFGETADGMLFIAMELLSGRSLTEIIKKEAPLAVDRAVRIALQLCLALDHAHAQGIVHRDLKPDNVMLAAKGEAEDIVKVLDFGIAKITEGEGSAEALTEAGLVFGTPEYLAPEQAAGQAADPRADLYALGIILYEMLAGERPFTAPTKLELLGKHIHEKPTPLRKAKPDLGIPAELDRVVLRILEKRPEDRFQSAAEIFEAISGIESITTGSLPLWPSNTLNFTAHTAVRKLPRPRAKRKLLLLGALGGGILAAVAAISIIALSGDGRKPAGTKRSGAARQMVKPRPGAERAPDALIQTVQTLLTSANLSAAQTELERLADRHPTDARVHLLSGQLFFLKNEPGDSLRAFREAVRLDPSMKSNELLLGRISDYLTWIKGRGYGWELRREAMEFVERYLDAGAAGMLTGYVNSWWERDLVWRVIEFLMRHNASDKVDFVHAYELVFRNEKSCDKRREYVQDIIKRKDPKFLPLLGQIMTTNAWKGKYSRYMVDNKCIRQEVQAAITLLEALQGEDMAPRPSEGVEEMGPAPREDPRRNGARVAPRRTRRGR